MRKGQKHTKEWKKRVSKIHKSRDPVLEAERRKKIGFMGKGRVSAKPMFGRKHTSEAKEKIRVANSGRKRNSKQIENISLAHMGQTPWNKGKPSKIRGKLHPLWTGETPLRRRIRLCFEYRQWRSDCMTRDDFTCQICFKRGGDLEVNHIKRFGKILDENSIKTFEEAIFCSELWNINNGETLCKDCHKKITYGN